MPLVEVKDLTLQFGGLTAVDQLNFSVEDHSIVGLIGPNGAGKTSVFNMLTGFYKPTRGQIWFRGKNTIGKKPNKITQMGMARTFQNIRLFSSLSVLENVMSGMHSKTKQGILGAIFRTRKQRQEEEYIRSVAYECLSFVGVDTYANRIAKNLSYGIQRKVEIARALATQPKLLLLDEPAAGLNTKERKELIELILRIREHYGLSILLIEHDIGLVREVAERLIVLDYGKKIADAHPDEVLKNPRVIEAYLGKDETDE